MEKLPENMNWKAFSDYLCSKYEWFGETVSSFFGFDGDDESAIKYRRVDHILSDKDIAGDKIVLKIQDGDPFVESLESYVVFMNSIIRKKYDCYFTVEKVDYF